MKFKWFKLWTEVRTDAKLRALSPEHRWVWLTLLSYASEQDERGTIRQPSKLVAAECFLSGPPELVTICNELASLQLIEIAHCDEQRIDLTFPSFAERQAKAPSDEPASVKARVQKHRRKHVTAKSDVTTCNEFVTSGNENETNCNDIQKQREKKREEKQQQQRATPPEETQSIPMKVERYLKDRTEEDRRHFREAVHLLESHRRTEHLAKDLQSKADTPEVGPLECWQLLQAARLVAEPGSKTFWGWFIGCARKANFGEFESYKPKPDPNIMPSQTVPIVFHTKERARREAAERERQIELAEKARLQSVAS